ncbi:hypothetical protein SESBI_44178 [Sesbania bispinosa]|nr:hypothetical protein SESBI_44178 [Sesbania bispinosa]
MAISSPVEQQGVSGHAQADPSTAATAAPPLSVSSSAANCASPVEQLPSPPS